MREDEAQGFLSRLLPSTICCPARLARRRLAQGPGRAGTGISRKPGRLRNACRIPTTSDFDTGSALATNEGNPTGAAATTSATDPSATSATSAASAQAGTMLSLLSGPSSSATPSSAGTLLSQVLSGKSSSAAVAVTSAINQSILDTLL
jgi:hypothetical protein